MSYQHLGFDLLQGLQDNTGYDDDGGTAEGYVRSEISVEEYRDNSDDAQTYSADKYDIVKDCGKIIHGWLSGTDTRNKAALFLHVICDLQRIECDGGIEVSK